MFRMNMVFFTSFYIFGNKQQDITSTGHFLFSQSDQDLCLLTKLMDTLEYMDGQQQSRVNHLEN